MRPLCLVATVALLTLPTLASAQFGGMGGGRGGMGGRGGPGGMGGRGVPGGFGQRRAPEYVKAKELLKYNLASRLLHDARKLHLTDPQKAQLASLETAITERNAPLVARYDSLRQNFTPPRNEDMRRRRGDDTDDDNDRRRREDPAADSARAKAFLMADAIDQIITRRVQDAAEALAFIAEVDRPHARTLIDEQTREMEERLPHLHRLNSVSDEAGGRGRGGRRGPP